MKIDVSIIIPVFNVAQYIKRCLNSVANQTKARGVECILIDDCGSDNSMDIVENYIKDYKGTILFRISKHAHNRGLSAARNTGINIAQGKYLYFLDSDDEITPDCICSLFDLAERHDADLVQGTYLGNHKVLSFFHKSIPEFTEDKVFIKKAMLNYDLFPVMAQNRLVKKDLLINNNIFFKEGIIHEDNHWTFFLAKHVNRLTVCPTPTYYYRTTPGSITNNRNIEKEINSFHMILEDYCDNIDSFLRGEQKACILRLLNNAISNHYYKSKTDKYNLFDMLYRKCSMHEKAVLRSWISSREGTMLRAKMFNLCTRLFQISK